MVDYLSCFMPKPIRVRWGYLLMTLGMMLCLCVILPGFSSAETLNEALAAAYRNNPTLNAERAKLRAIDEEVPRAKSGFRPRVTGSAETGFESNNTSPPSITDGKNYPSGYSVTLNQPVFRGFRTINQVREAEAGVFAGREDLRAVEQSVLINGITAYMDVVRDQAIVRLRQNNVKVLTEQLRATQDRFDVGEVTKTDVAQAKARRSGAVSQLNLAQSNLKTSRASFHRIMGHRPSNLRQPTSIDRALPRSLSEATQIGDNENPTVLAAVFREKASRHAVDRITGELLPEVQVEATYSRAFDPIKGTQEREATTVTGRVTVPFYQGGEVSARVRQAKQTNDQRVREVDQAHLQVRSDVISAWGRLDAARAQLESDKAQVEANRTALSGVREEEKVGQRTVLDVLDAEQELLDSQVTLVSTRRDLVVASYTLLLSIGRLTAADLGLPVAIYDAEAHYRRVKYKWFGLGSEKGDQEYRRHNARSNKR